MEKGKNKKYFHKGTGYSFSLPRLYTEDDPEVIDGTKKAGTTVYRTDPHSGHVLRGPGGVPMVIKDSYRFQLYPDGATFKDGLWCFYNVTTKTPEHVAKYLQDCLNNPRSGITDYDGYITARNPERMQEIKRRREVEFELKSKDREIEELRAKLEAASASKPKRARAKADEGDQGNTDA